MADILTLEELLKPDNEQFDFIAESWGRKRIILRKARVADVEKARVAARGQDGKFNNAVFQCVLFALCSVNPKIPEIEAGKLQEKSALEIERAFRAIMGEEQKSLPLP